MRLSTQEMAERQEAVVLFRDAILRESVEAPKFSPALIQMREMEKTLANTSTRPRKASCGDREEREAGAAGTGPAAPRPGRG